MSDAGSLMPAALYCRVSIIQKHSNERAADEKSVDDQEREGRAWADRTGVQLVEVFRDPGLSASRFATKERPDFQRLIALVAAGKIDVAWVWAIDRSQRDLRVFTELRDLFQKHQVALSVNGKLHNPSDYDDWMMLGMTSMFGERYSEELSKNVTRGQTSTAAAGEPHGPLTYGYRRVRVQHRPEGLPDDRVWVDKRTKQYVYQEPNWWDGDGNPGEDSPAAVVREIFERIKAGDATTRIARDLNARGIPLPGGVAPTPKAGWRSSTIRRIALNPVYIGARVRQHDWSRPEDAHRSVLDGVAGKWPPLVDEDVFWAVHKVFTSPERKQTRSGAKSLLSCLVTCGKCGGNVAAGWTFRSGGSRYRVYACINLRCASITKATLDEYVQEIVVGGCPTPTCTRN